MPKPGRGCRGSPPCRDGWGDFARPCKLHTDSPPLSSAWYQRSLAPFLIASFDYPVCCTESRLNTSVYILRASTVPVATIGRVGESNVCVNRRALTLILTGLETYCLPVAARIAGGKVAAVELPDHLAAAELVVVVHGDDAMPAALQLLERSSGEAVLDAHLHALHDTEARAVAGRLRALLVVSDAYHHLCVALRLHGAAHHAEAHHRPAVFRDKARNDGLVRALAGSDAIGMARLEYEVAAAVLQRDAFHHDSRAEAHEVRLDEGDHNARRIGRGEVHRAAFRRIAVAEILRAFGIDELRPRLQVFLVEQRLRAHVHVVDVAYVAPAIGKGELHRLDLQMHAVGGVDRVRAQVKV